MLIVDAQIHLWEKGTPSAHHRQEPYSAEQAIAGMDDAGVDRALIHSVLWDPDSNELAVEAVRKYLDRFGRHRQLGSCRLDGKRDGLSDARRYA
jgi:predicted TIM-barrel fold metal-dependent hydrolase